MAHCEAEQGPRAPRPELAEILAEYAGGLPRLSRDQARVVSALTACRTAALGGRLMQCDHCGREAPVYNSCRNRHCPKCQSLDQALWVEAQARDLLPIPSYFHIVFTISHDLNLLFLRDPRVTYPLLFATSAATLIEICRSNLGVTPGVIAVLHTWNQLLLDHFHVHCIATGGGLSQDGTRWVSSRPNFFLPVKQLSEMFQGKLLEALELALVAGRLRITEAAGRPLLRRAAGAYLGCCVRRPFSVGRSPLKERRWRGLWELVDAGPQTELRRTASKRLWETRSVFQAGVDAQSAVGDFEGASMPAAGAAASAARFEAEPSRERGCGGEGRRAVQRQKQSDPRRHLGSWIRVTAIQSKGV